MSTYRILLLLFATILLGGGVGACTKFDDDFTESPADQLTFSVDTLSFDTLFTEVPTTTRQVMVYNRHDKPIQLDRIYLAHAGSSGFRINVDGRSGSQFQDIQIAANDSMYVFVEMTAVSSGQTSPLWSVDSICFERVNTRQRVVLEGAGQDVTRLRKVTFTENMTLDAPLPYLIFDTLTVAEGATLTLPAGAELYFHAGGTLHVKGRIVAEGTLASPVLLRGDRLDNLFAGTPYDRVPGQWNGILIDSLSFDNRLSNTYIRNTYTGITAARSNPSQVKLTMFDCTLSNAIANLLSAQECRMDIQNCELSNAGGAIASLIGGSYLFRHCTLANYYSWDVRKSAVVALGNWVYDGQGQKSPRPLEEARFENCIIHGSMGTEVALSFEPKELTPYLFDYCLIKAKGTDDANFIRTQWNKDPKFLATGKENMYYDYRIDSLSEARGKANPATALLLPFDRNGNSRLTMDGSDIGAYQWIPKP